jgi:U3 small nucleolar RNA-associated protein 13
MTIVADIKSVEAVGYLSGSESQYIYTGGSRGIVRLWDTKSRREIAQSDAVYNDDKETGGILDVMYYFPKLLANGSHNSQKKTLLAVLGDQTLLVYKTDSGSLSLEERMFGQHDEILDCAFVGSSENHLAIAPNESEIRIINIQTTACEVLSGHRDIILCLDKSHSGEWLASGSKDHEARLWKLEFSNDNHVVSSCFAILKGHTGSVSAIALPRKKVSGTPTFVITASDDRTVKCWDMATGRTTTPFTPRSLYTQKAHDKDINSVDVSFDDRLFATASQDRTVKVFNVDDGQVIGVLKGHRRGVFSAKFSATERVVASGSGDGTVKLWSLNDYTCLKAISREN